jgi:hypothetical protein
MAVAFVVFYYLVPDIMFYLGTLPVNKNIVLLMLFLVIAIMEFLRLVRWWNIKLFRDYERHRISAPFWFSSTAALLILLTPQWIAIPCILCVTFADPVIGELRLRGIRSYPFFGWLVCLVGFLVFTYPVIVAMVIAGAATLVEIVKIPINNKNSPVHVAGIFDDNFTMQFVPAMLILFIWMLSLELGLPWLLPNMEPLLVPIY